MAQLVPYARLLAVAAFTSLTLTSCFDKQCDPRPSCAAKKAATTTPTTPGN